MSSVMTLSRTETMTPTTSEFSQGQGRRLGDAAVECSVCPPVPRPNAEITSIHIEQSQALPEHRNDVQPLYWNNELRGNPPYRRVLRNQDFHTRPL